MISHLNKHWLEILIANSFKDSNPRHRSNSNSYFSKMFKITCSKMLRTTEINIKHIETKDHHLLQLKTLQWNNKESNNSFSRTQLSLEKRYSLPMKIMFPVNWRKPQQLQPPCHRIVSAKSQWLFNLHSLLNLCIDRTLLVVAIKLRIANHYLLTKVAWKK